MTGVLLVDDEPLVLVGIQSMLKWEDYDAQVVGAARNGAQALELIDKLRPDLVIADIKMPVMDGLEAARAIRSMDREDCHTVPIIAMSANAFDDDLKKSVECGMNGHLSKPVEVDKLYRTLNEILRGRSRDALHPANFV